MTKQTVVTAILVATAWMALSAALPVTWSPVLVFFGITIILGLIDWTGLARAVRSKLLALREEDFATAESTFRWVDLFSERLKLMKVKCAE